MLRSVHPTGYRTFEIDLVDGRRRPIPGFVGFAVDLGAPPGADVRSTRGWQSLEFLVTDAVMDTLSGAGVTGYRRTRVSSP